MRFNQCKQGQINLIYEFVCDHNVGSTLCDEKLLIKVQLQWPSSFKRYLDFQIPVSWIGKIQVLKYSPVELI